VKFPKVCIVILNWNGKNLLKDCLSSLFKLTDYPNYKVIVVDNGSIDGSVEFVKKKFPKVDVLALDKNYGFSKGNNIGIKYALKKYRPKYILLLNNDTKIIQKDWLTKLVETAENDKKVGIVGPKLIYPDGRIQHAGVSIKSLKHRGTYEPGSMYTTIEEVDAVTGACMLISTKTISKIGCLDEVYSPYTLEDIDLCIRAKHSGFKIIFNGKVVVIHQESVSIKKKISAERFYFILRNRLILLFRYYPTHIKILEVLKSFLRIFISRKDSHLPFYGKNIRFNRDFSLRFFLFISGIFQALVSCSKFKTKFEILDKSLLRKKIEHGFY